MSDRLTVLHTNRCYSWHTSSLAKKINSNIYTVGVNNTDDWGYVRYNKTTQAITTSKIYDGYESDDHNAPSMCFNLDKRKFVLFTRHKQSNLVNYSSTDSGGTTFGNHGTKSFPDVVTYSQILNTGGNALTGLTRVGNKAWYTMVTSNYQDDPVTFVTNKLLECTDISSQLYVNTRRSEANPDLWHFVIFAHPIDSVFKDVAYGTINYSTGDISNFAGVIGNFRTPTNTPLHWSDFDVLGLEQSGVRHRVLGCGDKYGLTYIDVCKWTTNNDDIDNEYWRYVQQEDGTWEGFYLGISAGTEFYSSSSRYVGGIDSDRNGANKCYIGYNAGGVHKMVMFPINDDLTLDFENDVLVASDDEHPYVRPFCVEGDDSVIFLELVDYTSYTDFDAKLLLYEVLSP